MSPSEVPTGKRPVRRSTRRKWVYWAAAALVIVGGYYWYVKAHSKPASKMITAVVTRGDLTETITATGSITAQTGAEVHIGSQITGVIKKLHADVGQDVKAGSIIAELDLPDLTAQLKQAQQAYAAASEKAVQAGTTLAQTRSQVTSQLAQSSATVESMRQKYISARETANQNTETVPTDIVRAQNNVSSAVAALNTARASLTQTQAGTDLQISVAQSALNQAKANAVKSDSDLSRNQQLYDQGYLAAADLDTAIATAKVNRAAVVSAQQNVTLTEQKVTADLQTAKDQVVQAQQALQVSRQALRAAQSEHHSVTARLADEYDAKAALAEAEAGLEVAKANLQNVTLRQQDLIQAEDSQRQTSHLVEYDQAQVNKSIIKTPISGTVLNLSVQQGETLAAGLAAPTVINVADLNRLEVDAYVDETDIAKVKLGQSATVTCDAFPQKTFTGTVAKIASGSTIQQGVVTYDVAIKLDNQGHMLKPDMTASVTIVTGNQKNVLLVPSIAVQVGTKGSRVNVVRTVNGSQTVVSVPVKTGGSDGLNTQIISGLNEGDTVVLAGTNLPGQRQRAGPANPFGPSTGKSGGGKAGG